MGKISGDPRKFFNGLSLAEFEKLLNKFDFKYTKINEATKYRNFIGNKNIMRKSDK